MNPEDMQRRQARHQRLQRWLGPVRDAMTILGTVVTLLVLGHFLLGCGKRAVDIAKGLRSSGVSAEEALVTGYPGADRYAREMALATRFIPRPYYHWRRPPYDGSVVKVEADSTRRTIKQPRPGAKRVFVFGGSTLWGVGATDAYTIPSCLQREFGDDYDFYNLGESAFVSVQELNLLLERLALGDRPDAVIFYDGFNDGYAGIYSPAIPRSPQSREVAIRQDWTAGELLVKLIRRTNYDYLWSVPRILRREKLSSQWDRSVEPHIGTNATATVDCYAQFMRQCRGLAHEYSFPVYFVWQPVLLASAKKLTPAEAAIVERERPVLIAACRTLYQQAATRFAKEPDFVNLADAFDNVTETLYWDACHVGPRGNELVAKRLHELLRDRL